MQYHRYRSLNEIDIFSKFTISRISVNLVFNQFTLSNGVLDEAKLNNCILKVFKKLSNEILTTLLTVWPIYYHFALIDCGVTLILNLQIDPTYTSKSVLMFSRLLRIL